jgi:hypothetical protein
VSGGTQKKRHEMAMAALTLGKLEGVAKREGNDRLMVSSHVSG